MKPTPNLLDVAGSVDNLLVIALLASHLNLWVLETFCPCEKIG